MSDAVDVCTNVVMRILFNSMRQREVANDLVQLDCVRADDGRSVPRFPSDGIRLR